jgi:hypothetical protein
VTFGTSDDMDWVITSILALTGALLQFLFAHEFTLLRRLQWPMGVRGYFTNAVLRTLHWLIGVTLVITAIIIAPHYVAWIICPALWVLADYWGTRMGFRYFFDKHVAYCISREGMSEEEAYAHVHSIIRRVTTGKLFPPP